MLGMAYSMSVESQPALAPLYHFYHFRYSSSSHDSANNGDCVEENLSRSSSLSSEPTDAPPLRNRVVEPKLEVRIVLLLQVPKSLESPRLISIDRFQGLISMCVVDVCR